MRIDPGSKPPTAPTGSIRRGVVMKTKMDLYQPPQGHGKLQHPRQENFGWTSHISTHLQRMHRMSTWEDRETKATFLSSDPQPHPLLAWRLEAVSHSALTYSEHCTCFPNFKSSLSHQHFLKPAYQFYGVLISCGCDLQREKSQPV